MNQVPKRQKQKEKKQYNVFSIFFFFNYLDWALEQVALMIKRNLLIIRDNT